MAFPNNPNDQDQTTVNGILYEYSSARNSWDKIPYATRNGASAYNIAVANGFVGTEQQWLDSLVVASGVSDYNDLTNKPTLFDGQYSSLTGAPTIPADVSELTDTTNLLDHFSGDYVDLTNKPTIPENIDDLSDVVITSATSGQVLKFNGTNWVNGTDSTGSGGGGGGASIGSSLAISMFLS